MFGSVLIERIRTSLVDVRPQNQVREKSITLLDEEWENTFRRWYPDFRPQWQAKKAA